MAESELFTQEEAAAYLASALQLSMEDTRQLLADQIRIGRFELLHYPGDPNRRPWIDQRHPPEMFADQVRAYARMFKPNLAGRKTGSELNQCDAPLLPVMHNLIRAGVAKDATEAARLVVGEDGSGAKGVSSSVDTKVDRLRKLYRKTYPERGE